MNGAFPTAPPTGLNVYWAPLVIEPVPDGPERFVAAVAAVSETGESGFRPLVNRQRLKAMFGGASVALGGVVDTGIASLQNFLAANGPRQASRHAPDLGGWASPLQGVYLGDSQVMYVSRFGDVFARAARQCSVFGGDFLDADGEDTAEPHPWAVPVVDVLKKLKPQLSNSLNAPVRLRTIDHAIRFTFYGTTLAANVVVLSPRRMAASLREARAHLWNLSLVAEVPDLLIRPGKLELLTGVTEDSPQTRSAIEELAFEAMGRSVNVSRVESSEDAARQIIAKAA